MKDIHDILLSRKEAAAIIAALEALEKSRAFLLPEEQQLLDRLKRKIQR